MNTKPKIIHTLSIRPHAAAFRYRNPEDYIKNHGRAEFEKIDKPPYWVGFFEDFNHKTAIETLKRTDKYQIECWRPYGSVIDRPYEKDFDGICHRVFPSRAVRIPRVGFWHRSRAMLEAMKDEVRKNRKLIIHIHDGHDASATWLLLNLKPSNVPVLYQHRGYWFAGFDYRYRRKNPVSLLVHKQQVKMFGYISHYFSGSYYEYEYIRDVIGFKNSSYYMDGIDFDYFKPEDKKSVRKSLGLDPSKKYIVYVGRFNKLNGVDKLVRVFKKIKESKPDTELLLVGGYRDNECYNESIEAGATVVERVPQAKLKDYYNASDVYVMAIPFLLNRLFDGIGTATLQALACGVPVLTYNILHFPGTEQEKKKIGMSFDTEEDLHNNLVYMLDHPSEFKECRELARKYYDENHTMQVLLDKYEELFEAVK